MRRIVSSLEEPARATVAFIEKTELGSSTTQSDEDYLSKFDEL